jgi:nucleoid DNA-binding protein
MGISRANLSKRIHERLGGVIPYRTVHQAVGVIIEQISNDLLNDQVVSARHFGTLSPHVRPGHRAHNIFTGKIRELPSSRSVKLHPHDSFLSLLTDREDHFREKPAEKMPLEREVSNFLDGKRRFD